VQIAVGDRAGVAGLALPVKRDPVPGRREVTVEAIHRDVEPSSREPFHPRRVPLEDGVPALRPVDRLCLLGPESLEVLGGAPVDRVVFDERVGPELLRRLEHALLVEQRFDRCRLFAHQEHPLVVAAHYAEG
jgi:hypothetical protein